MSRFCSRWPSRQGPDEGGFAMIVATVVATVALLLVTVIMAMGLHLETASTRERRWQLALQIAEAGVEDATARLNTDLTYTGTGASTPSTVPGGQFVTRVRPQGAGFVVDSLGWVGQAGNRIQRRLRVAFAPEPSFRYALFSATTLTVKNGSAVAGDIFANGGITIEQNAVVSGNVISSQGTIDMGNNSAIMQNAGLGGSAFSGGLETSGSPRWGIRLSNGASIAGDAHVQVPSVSPCTNATDYNLINSAGTIGGKAYVGGTVVGTPPAGGTVVGCQLRQAFRSLPPYTFDRSNYPSMVDKTPAEFKALPSVSGQIFVTGSKTDVVEIGCTPIVDDLVLVTYAKIVQPNDCKPLYTGDSDAVVQIISLNDVKTTQADPAIDIENKLEFPSPSPAVLIYSLGFCDFKNSVLDNGAIYCNGMNIKNNIVMTYDPRIERLLNFGGSLYARTAFQELPSATPMPA